MNQGRYMSAVFALLMALSLSLQVRADLLVVVNKSNASPLTEEQIKNIFLGKSKYFPDGKPAIPVQMHPGSSAYEDFASKVLGKDDSQLRAYWSRLVFTGRATPPREVDSESQILQLVAHNPNLIGYVDTTVADTGIDQVRSLAPLAP